MLGEENWTIGGWQRYEPPEATLEGALSTEGEQKEIDNSEADKDGEPLCLEQSTSDSIPLHVRQLLAQYEGRLMPAAETLLLLIYVGALEGGYVEEETFMQKRHLLRQVPAFASFNAFNVRLLSQLPLSHTCEYNDTAYCLQLRTLLGRPCGEEFVVRTLKSRLMAVLLGDLLMVTLSPASPSKQPGYSVCLSIGRYVLGVEQRDQRDQPLCHRVRKLKELSFLLREKLFQPMRAQQLVLLQKHPYPSLLGLPGEIFDTIFKHPNKPKPQLHVVARVNRRLRFFSEQVRRRRAASSIAPSGVEKN